MTTSRSPLEIKFGVVKRAVKELEMYKEEVRRGEEGLVSGMEEDRIKQARAALEESRSMVANTHDRLQVAIKDLANLVSVEDNKTSPLMIEANEWLDKARKLVTAS